MLKLNQVFTPERRRRRQAALPEGGRRRDRVRGVQRAELAGTLPQRWVEK